MLIGHSWGGNACNGLSIQRTRQGKKMILLDSDVPNIAFIKVFSSNFNKKLTEEDNIEINRLDSLGLSTLRGAWPGYFYD